MKDRTKVLKKALRIAKIEGKKWKTELKKEIDGYNQRPHSVTGYAPAQLLWKRPVRGLLPAKKSEYRLIGDCEDALDRDRVEKFKSKEYADRKRKARENDIEIGDTV